MFFGCLVRCGLVGAGGCCAEYHFSGRRWLSPELVLLALRLCGRTLPLTLHKKGSPSRFTTGQPPRFMRLFSVPRSRENLPLPGFHDPASVVNSIQKPRDVMMLAGSPVDQTIATLAAHLEQGDCIVDGGNEWYQNSESKEKVMEERGLLYLGMGVSGGEEGARHGPSKMLGGTLEAYQYIEDIPDSGPCVTYIGGIPTATQARRAGRRSSCCNRRCDRTSLYSSPIYPPSHGKDNSELQLL